MAFVDVLMGVDVGQKVDLTAICIVEATTRQTGRTVESWHTVPILDVWECTKVPELETTYIVRHLERLPLGTPYPEVGRRVAAMCEALVDMIVKAEMRSQRADPELTFKDTEKTVRAQAPCHVRLTVDGTGVGAPVVDLLREALRDVGVHVNAVTFTYGDRKVSDDAGVRVGKAFLVSRLQALLQTRRIKLPETDEARQLAKELADYEIKVDKDANDKYGAFRVGSHDDLVTALGLATLDDPMLLHPQLVPGLYD